MNVRLIINPSSGQEEPILNTLNRAFGSDVAWQVDITRKSGDGQRFARTAIASNIDVIAVYGGDGTVTEVASAIAGSNSPLPLLILPGGTGNGFARSLGISTELKEAASLLREGFVTQRVDLGRINEHTFLLRADVGFVASAGVNTDSDSKSRFGKWAYLLSGLQHINELKPSYYQLVLDDLEVEVEAIVVMVLNASAVAFGQAPFAEGITPYDGQLDVLALTRQDLAALADVTSSVISGNASSMQRWRVKSAEIHTPSPMQLSADGEPIGMTPAYINIWSEALNVIVPTS